MNKTTPARKATAAEITSATAARKAVVAASPALLALYDGAFPAELPDSVIETLADVGADSPEIVALENGATGVAFNLVHHRVTTFLAAGRIMFRVSR